MCGIQAVSEKHEDVQILCQHFSPLHKGDKCWAFGTAFLLTSGYSLIFYLFFHVLYRKPMMLLLLQVAPCRSNL